MSYDDWKLAHPPEYDECPAGCGNDCCVPESEPDDDEPECMGHDSAGEPGGCDLPYPRTVYCDGSCRRA